MYISDIPMHDASRDLMLMNEHWEEEWNLTQNLEILTDKLQTALAELETEKKKTDKLVLFLPSREENEQLS
jgi:guanylate cyclase soluble subunit beta